MAYGKEIVLFLVNGTADSVVTATLSNWNGKAIKLPRIEVNDCSQKDITQPGIYFLFCKDDDATESVYIGEAENVKDRLIQHLRDYNKGKEDYYWNTAVVFTGSDLDKADIRYLENVLVETAKECERYHILTKNTYKNTVMKESRIAAMEEFADNIKIIINTLGYKVLESLIQKDMNSSEIGNDILYLNIAGCEASGKVTTEGFVVFEGSKMSNKEAQKSLSETIRNLRRQYINDGKVVDRVLQQNILFSSSSAAANFLLGYTVSGPQSWKDKSGKLLKEIEALEIK